MRVLLLSFYYPPDLCACSFRAGPLVEALHKAGGQNLHIDVLTTMPNRYQSLKHPAEALEEEDGITIRRFPIPSHQSGMRDQARSFISFARQVLRHTHCAQEWDIVVATSSRLMTGALGALVARRTGASLYLDIRDLFSDTMGDLLAGSPLRLLVPAFDALETRVLRQADRINIVSDGFLSHVRSKAPQVDVRSFTNGIDDEFLNLDFSTQSKKAQSPDLPLIVYAGNIGEGQGLHAIVPQAAQALEGRARIRIIGDGGRKQALADRLQAMQLPNVELLDPVPRQALLEHYREADVLFLHLNDYAAFHKVLPSKIFEYAATAKSMLAGVGGFAAEFLRKEVAGAEVFDPCDADGMVEAFETLEPGAVISRDAFCEKYARAKIMAHMAADILSLGELRNS